MDWSDLIRQLDGVDSSDERIVAVGPKSRPLVEAINRMLARMEGETRNLEDQVELSMRLLEATPNGVLLANEYGRIQYLNKAFRSMIPLRLEPGGKLPMEVGAPAEIQIAMDRARGGESVQDMYCVSGVLDLSVSAVPMGEGSLVMVHDITRFRRAERARTDFVANVSHELRTPIAAIIGYTETLLADRDALDEHTAAMVDVVHRNGERLRTLFEDLLALHRIEARRRELPLVNQLLLPLLNDALQPAVDRAKQRKQNLTVRCAPELRAPVNEHAFESIVSNLASNASNYTPEGGTITIDVDSDGNEVRVRVTDNGIGISPAAHARIFERFYRVDAGRSRAVGGTGLGLAIAKHLAIASGCAITLESEEGAGSTFIVHIPVKPRPESRNGGARADSVGF